MPTRDPAKSRPRATPSRRAAAAVSEHLEDTAPDADMERRICEAVYESVMSQRLTPGTKLPEAALCDIFGVSRSVARKALQRLAHEHVVDLHHNRGAVVAKKHPSRYCVVRSSSTGTRDICTRIR
ncbi:winged helix-turn-helix domain-containing protein [Achromobacter xylosoxidans]|uniref:winged helix-turn-helix domain-containing protein n=1 Tax=Alcaligenes xylosoxydans xylosoxydans TaxID=85698 RepID=UPI00359CA00F